MLRVMIVDDHLVVREGIRMMLQDDPEIEVVAEAGSGEEAVGMADELSPDVILMDVVLPGIDGIETTRRVKKAHPETAVIILTVHGNDVYVIEAVNAGAAGYLTKDCSHDLLCYAVRSVREGATLLPSDLLHHVVERIVKHAAPLDDVDPKVASQLTERETEVLGLLAQGMSNRDICAVLCLAQVTVKKHVQSIIGKLGVSDRTQAAILGVRLGLSSSYRGLQQATTAAPVAAAGFR